MIQLRSDCLVFKMASGEQVPCSVETVTVELIGPAVELIDPEVIHNAASSVLHYFRHELGRTEVTVAEFSGALEKVLRSLGFDVVSGAQRPRPRIAQSDLRRLAAGSEKGFELAFFNALRAELQNLSKGSPEMVRITGLRSCVKQLVGARRWTSRCQQLNDQIVDFARTCWGRQRKGRMLVVD